MPSPPPNTHIYFKGLVTNLWCYWEVTEPLRGDLVIGGVPLKGILGLWSPLLSASQRGLS
jgi:hypothetical protein